MTRRPIVPLPQLLTLLASSVLAVGLAEFAFRALDVSYPELSADTIAAGQTARDPAEARAALAATKAHIKTAFSEVRVAPEMFADGATRALFLGDSFTFGAGLKDYDLRFSNLLEARINGELEAAGSRKRLHLFNAGIGGSNPIAWERYFERIAPVYQPQLVFAIFFLRDGTSLPTSLVMNRAEVEPIGKKYRGMLGYEWSAILRFLYHKLAWQEYSEQFKQKLTAAYVGSEEETATWRAQRAALFRIARACRQQGIPFHLVIFPMLLNLNDYEFFAIEDEIRRFAEQAAIPVFSITPGFLGLEDRSLWVAPVDQHPNAAGHRVAADTLHPYLEAAIAGALASDEP